VSTAIDVWCTDFKGWFRVGDGRRCDPFTLNDERPRRRMQPIKAALL
jgi:hypothetical protein